MIKLKRAFQNKGKNILTVTHIQLEGAVFSREHTHRLRDTWYVMGDRTVLHSDCDDLHVTDVTS